MKKKTILMACAILFGSISTMTAQVKLQPQNVDDVLKAMTLEEKAMLVVGGNRQIASSENNGMIGGHAQRVPGAAGATQAIPRLGIPSTVLTDGPAGVRINPKRDNDQSTYYCTGFPVGTALACTWNTQLVEEVGKCIGNEVLEYGCDVLLAPGMNIHRSPLCGRNFEYYSEDPYVTGKIGAAYVRGVQSQGVGTSVKHFAANSQETNRMGVDEVMSQRALREIYLKGFEIAVREAAPWTVMSSYNRINGPFTQENRELLTTILRDEWGFDGIVMTDWTGLRNTAAQIQAGNDLMEPGADSQIKDIIEKVKSG
ncbi:MAG: beta-glucosidase, partial [Prevotella sp.]|nr:beta-glucosidase [Prevotella sp.]